MRIKNPTRNIPIFLFVASVLPLMTAYIAEYGFGLLPCILCICQRIPLAIIAVVSSLVLIVRIKPDKIRPVLLICALAFLVGGGIAAFHVGVEQKKWHGTTNCGNSGISNTVEELRAKITLAPVVRCDEPAFIFMGLSMAGWNVIYSFALAFSCLFVFRKLKK